MLFCVRRNTTGGPTSSRLISTVTFLFFFLLFFSFSWATAYNQLPHIKPLIPLPHCSLTHSTAVKFMYDIYHIICIQNVKFVVHTRQIGYCLLAVSAFKPPTSVLLTYSVEENAPISGCSHINCNALERTLAREKDDTCLTIRCITVDWEV